MKVLNLVATFHTLELFIDADGAFTDIGDGDHANLVTVGVKFILI